MFFSAWFVPYQKFSFSAVALAGLARVGLRSSSVIETVGLPDLWALVSPCIGEACLKVFAAGTEASVAMSLTS